MVALAGPAQAKGSDENFWASLIAPNAEEIDLVLEHARALRLQAMQYTLGQDPAYANSYDELQREQRRRRLEDAYGMLRYALRELDPEQPELLYEIGRNADDIGRYDEVLEALGKFVDIAENKDRRVVEAYIRIGRIRARYGEWDEAITAFKRSLVSRSSANRGVALLYLGCAYMHSGQIAEAIDVLSQAAEMQAVGYQYYVAQSSQFALAVAYDRDEQITRSHEVLEKLIAQDRSLTYVLGSPYNYNTPDVLDARPLLVPPHERQYFLALKYEATGLLEEARAQWLTYTKAADDGPIRDRALAHIEDLDEMLDERLDAADNDKTKSETVKKKRPRRKKKRKKKP